MKNIDFEDSSELFDSTSGSGDDYIANTTAESDSDSEASLKTKVKFKQPLQDFIVEKSSSTTLPECDSTAENVNSDRPTFISESARSDEEPCSSQTLVVSATQKKGGKRVYDKRHYCLYCSKPYAKMARHLEHIHEDKCDVAKALSFPKGSRQRKQQLDDIRNRGNYAHNAAAMESGRGELVPFRRPPSEKEGNDFMHCAYCQALFTRKVLWRHLRSCRLKPGSVTQKPGKNRVQSLCTYTGPVPSNMTKQLWETISIMTPDAVTGIIKNDPVIINIGQHLLNKGGPSARNQQCVREKMRELGRLIYNARKITT